MAPRSWRPCKDLGIGCMDCNIVFCNEFFTLKLLESLFTGIQFFVCDVFVATTQLSRTQTDHARISVLETWIAILFFALHPSSPNCWNLPLWRSNSLLVTEAFATIHNSWFMLNQTISQVSCKVRLPLVTFCWDCPLRITLRTLGLRRIWY